MKNALRWIGFLGVLALIAAAGVRHFTPGHALTGYQVQQLSGAGNCERSDYYLRDKLDGSKATLFDCWTSGKGHMCVTVENGIASNVTVEARALFAATLGTTKPACASG